MNERQILHLPEHKNPSPGRTASAPYNFVPLPETVVKAVEKADDLPCHDHYDPDRHTGYFDVTLTTRSPLYIRCPLKLDKFLEQERGEDADKDSFRNQVKNTPDFFYTRDKHQPVIPGSSLRGMLRSLLEIVSYGKMQWVTDKRLFFRTVDDSAVGLYYNGRLVEEIEIDSTRVSHYRSLVRGGFFHRRADGSYFIEECDVARVEVNDILAMFKLRHRRELYQLNNRDLTEQNERNPNQAPSWKYQHRDIWAEVDPLEQDYFFAKKLRPDGRLRHPDLYLRFQRARNLLADSDATTDNTGSKKLGKLVLTGHMQFKHLAFMFLARPQSTPIEVPNDQQADDPNEQLVDRFHDEEQITRWQTNAFPDGKPSGAHRQQEGHLREGEPVFFLQEEERLVFFGRAQMFRLPYECRPIDLVPDELRLPEHVDYAEALFGFVRTPKELRGMKERDVIDRIPAQGEKTRAYAGRVFLTDGVLVGNPQEILLAKESSTLKILATPKPTAFQHYLTQQNPDEPKKLNHYDSEFDGNLPYPGRAAYKTVIRGHKRYWHQKLGIKSDLTPKELEERLGAIKQVIEETPEKLKEIKRQESQSGSQNKPDTQHTECQPLRPGVQFKFRVYFENLSDEELGSLCWTLHPLGPDQAADYCHHLGMGKPLGMGVVKLEATLHRAKQTGRKERYKSLFTGDEWQTEALGAGEKLSNRKTLEGRTVAFEIHVLSKLPRDLNAGRFQFLYNKPRIKMLLKMLKWPGFAPEPQQPDEASNLYLSEDNRPNTRYMDVGEFRGRYVLPSPEAFIEGRSQGGTSASGRQYPQANSTQRHQQQGRGGGRNPNQQR